MVSKPSDISTLQHDLFLENSLFSRRVGAGTSARGIGCSSSTRPRTNPAKLIATFGVLTRVTITTLIKFIILSSFSRCLIRHLMHSKGRRTIRCDSILRIGGLCMASGLWFCESGSSVSVSPTPDQADCDRTPEQFDFSLMIE